MEGEETGVSIRAVFRTTGAHAIHKWRERDRGGSEDLLQVETKCLCFGKKKKVAMSHCKRDRRKNGWLERLRVGLYFERLR